MESAVAVLQHEVQRKLGCCMLRLQQYERLLKAVLPSMAVAGPPEQLQAVQGKQALSMRNRTLGSLVGMFTEQHLTAASADIQVGPDEDTGANGQTSDASWASIRFTISMSPERHAQTKAGLVELVNLRNDLVHHLIERFDISDASGCRAASSHLDSCYQRIDGHCQLLKTWASNLGEFRTRVSSLVQSKAFEDAFVHGANPDGSVCWTRSSIVECLRNAEAAYQTDGWTPLDAAITFISKEHRDQTPRKYGCRTWRQVLKKSGLFELRSSASPVGKRGQTWYRSQTAPR
ncbi:OST-HTH/LOTUS domain-containing protein [Massilia sp. 9096]|uniref:OST-HTH/LOTUS domain-containing protein n=1 Tax=Massilia sp. 9096 TaxID=1500894 RepID=UPI0012E04B80|nr:OST-HTH/LOTUS domain-containing protein [Massilia sp. 9096]